MTLLATIERMGKVMEQTWWLPDTAQIVDRPELCYYLHSGRNRVLRLSAPPERIPALVGEFCAAIGDESGTVSFYPHRHGAVLRQALEKAGFAPGHRHEGRFLNVLEYTSRPTPGIEVRRVESFEAMKGLYDVRAQAFGEPHNIADSTIQLDLENCTGADARTRQFLAVDAETGQALSQAGLAMYPHLNLAFFFGGGTVPSGRGRGAYTALVAARVAYARSQGFDLVGLFARENTSAPIVARQGFQLCGEMTYWERSS